MMLMAGVEGPATGFSVNAALPLMLGLAAEVAIIRMVCWVVRFEGAVYTPFATVPTFGLSDQVTDVFIDPPTMAVKFAD